MTTARVSQRGQRVIVHVDMDAFFASVELLRRPELRGRPVVVGGAGARGVVAAASYEARCFGIHSAMPSVRAVRLCPDAVFLDGDHAHYSEVSARIMEIFRSVTPEVEPLSLDEAFLDITGTRRLLGEPADVARWLRERVHEEEGLWCSVGIAPNKFLSKLATNSAKPTPSPTGPLPGRGVFEVAAGDELSFLHPLAVQRLWGVGPATLAKLQGLGIATVGDVAATPLELLASALGPAAGLHLHELSTGRDDRAVVPDREPKSISHEVTFPTDLVSMDALRAEAVQLSEAVASRLRHHRYRGRTVKLKVRYRDFSTVTRSMTLERPSDRGTDLLDTAWTMLLKLPVERGVRLLGIGMAKLTREPDQQQLDLGDAQNSNDDGWDAANGAVDAIRTRFGTGLIKPARLAGRTTGDAARPWGPGE